MAALGAGVLWGFIGILTKMALGSGIVLIDVLAVRVTVGFSFLIGILFLAGPRSRIRRGTKSFTAKHVIFACLHGTIGVALTLILYGRTVELAGAGIAVALSYTGPVFVAVISRLVFRIRFTGRKTVAVILAFAGCILVSGLIGIASDGPVPRLSVAVVFMGIGTGLCFAMNSVLGYAAFAAHGTAPDFALTIKFLVASFGFSSILLWAMRLFSFGMEPPGGNLEGWLYVILLGLVSTGLAYTLSIYALQCIDPPKASIIGTIELVVAVCLARVILHEMMLPVQAVGCVLILGSALLVAWDGHETMAPERARLGANSCSAGINRTLGG